MNETRLEKLKVKMAEQALDWIALVPSPSFTYLSGMHAHTSERPIVMFISAETVAVIIPTLEAVKAEEAGIDPAHIFAWSDQEGYVGAFEKAAQTLGLAGATMGVEALKMRVLERDMLMSVADGLILQHADGVLDDLRLRKDSAEIAAMQHAVDVAEKAMHAVLPQIKIGMTERQVAGKIVSALFDAGADGVAFGPIVSAGAKRRLAARLTH